MVVDEYGGTTGILTLAHIGNELLGQSAHEGLPDIPDPEQIGENRWRYSRPTPLEHWEPLLDEDDATGCVTIAGFVTKLMGTIPQPGDRYLYKNLLFEIEAVEERRVATVCLDILPMVHQARRMTTQGRL